MRFRRWAWSDMAVEISKSFTGSERYSATAAHSNLKGRATAPSLREEPPDEAVERAAVDFANPRDVAF